MIQAYSQLKQILSERKLTVAELYRRIQQRGMKVNLKSLYRLNREHQPVERLDLRVAGTICQLFEVSLSELVRFEMEDEGLLHFPANKQQRLDTLMAKNNDGRLTDAEHEELRALVHEAEAMTLANAHRLAGQRQQLAAHGGGD
jgi:DNA-binding Xre family transcriptional regulator